MRSVDEYTYLSNEALLAKLLGTRQSQRVYRGNLNSLFSPAGGFVPGKLLAARELMKRLMIEELRSKPALTSPGVVRDYLRLLLGHLPHEVFVCVWLDAQHRVIEAQECFKGTLTQTSVYPREVVKAALRANAGAVILAHNHPSGAAQPSRADELLTRNLKEALGLVDVKVLDHFIVAGNQAISFAERGII